MRPIDLVKHQTRILPGLEEAAHSVIGRLNAARKILNLNPVLLIEDHFEVRALNQLGHSRILKPERIERQKRKKAEAEQTRLRIARREQDARLKTRNMKTLVKRRRA